MSRTQFNKTALIKTARQLRSPFQVQQYVRTLNYNSKSSLQSALGVFQSHQAHCMEAAHLISLLLELIGYPPLVMSFESIDGLDHVISVFEERTGWGSVGFSRDEGLFGRRPVFQSLKELAQSYFDPYVDKSGCIHSFQVAHLDETRSDWRYGRGNIWAAENFLFKIKHEPIKIPRSRFLQMKKRYLKHGSLPAGHDPRWW